MLAGLLLAALLAASTGSTSDTPDPEPDEVSAAQVHTLLHDAERVAPWAVAAPAGLLGALVSLWTAWPAIAAARRRIEALVGAPPTRDAPSPAPPAAASVPADLALDEATEATAPTIGMGARVARLEAALEDLRRLVVEIHHATAHRDPHSQAFTSIMNQTRILDALADLYDSVQQLARIHAQVPRDRD